VAVDIPKPDILARAKSSLRPWQSVMRGDMNYRSPSMLPQYTDETAKIRYIVPMAKSSRATPLGSVPTRRRAELASPPFWIKPQLAKLVEKAPDGPDWLHELKLDGYRMHARLDAGRVQILTRRRTNTRPSERPLRGSRCRMRTSTANFAESCQMVGRLSI
jgi:hypothetical protein